MRKGKKKKHHTHPSKFLSRQKERGLDSKLCIVRHSIALPLLGLDLAKLFDSGVLPLNEYSMYICVCASARV